MLLEERHLYVELWAVSVSHRAGVSWLEETRDDSGQYHAIAGERESRWNQRAAYTGSSVGRVWMH